MKTVLELGVLAGCGLLLAREAARASAALALPGGPALLAAGGLVGYLAADLACGVVHWACDTFLDEDAPLVGPAVIAPFREHHRDPLAITRRGVAEVSSYNCGGVAALLVLVGWLAPGPPATPAAAVAAGCLVGFGLAVAVTNQLHRWAHAARVPAPVRWAQRLRLVLAPAAHAVHHRHGRGAYCVTSGWLNGPLDRAGIPARVETGVRALAAFAAGRRRGGGWQ